MRELLARHIPQGEQQELRGYEWHFLWKHTSLDSTVVFRSDRPLYCVRLSPDGKTIAVTGADGKIHLLSTETFAVQAILATSHGEVNSVEFSPDGKELASAGDDGKIVSWNLSTNRPTLSFQGYEKPAFCALFADDWILGCGKHNDIRVWTKQDGRLDRELKTHQETVQAITLTSRGFLAAGSDDGSVSCWNYTEAGPKWHDIYANGA